MTLYIGIDQSYTSTGYVVTDENSTVIDSEIIRTTKEIDEFERVWFVSQKLINVIHQYKPDIVVIEGLAFGSRGDATRKLAGLQFVIITQLRYNCEHKCPIHIVPPTTLKKFATTSGKAKKEQMLQSVPIDVKEQFQKMYKKSKGLYDIVDAYFLSQYAIMLSNK